MPPKAASNAVVREVVYRWLTYDDFVEAVKKQGHTRAYAESLAEEAKTKHDKDLDCIMYLWKEIVTYVMV